MRTNRNVKLLNAHAAFTGMMFVIPVIMPFYRDQMGLGFREFLIAESAFAATMVLLDVPTGWISDMWRRKDILALGALLDMFGFGLMLLSHSLFMAALAQIVTGMGLALVSGTNSATLYESLMCNGREGEYRRREGKRAGFGLYSIACASVLGGFMYPRHHQWPVMFTILALFCALVCACLMDEPERHRRSGGKHPIADIVATARYAVLHPDVGLIIIFAAVMFCATKLIMWSQQPYYMALGLPEGIYGILMAVGFGLGGLSSHWGHALDGKVGTFRALAVAWAATVGTCLGAAMHLGLQGVALMMIGGSCTYGMTAPRVSEAINRHVDPARRATILSTQSLLVSLLFIPLSWVLGFVAKHWGIQAVLFALAVWLGIAGVSLVLWRRRS